MTLIHGVDYSVVNPDNKWQILKSQKRFAFWALLISAGVVMQGFDIVAGGQLASLPAFKEKFGVKHDGTYIIPAHYLSAWNSIAPATEVVTTFIFVPLLDKFGRKWGILAAMLISCAGVVLQQMADNWRVHLAGRGVNGIAIGMMFTISPLWIGETCRPELRGFFLCFFNTSIVVGQFAIVIVAEGSSHITTKWQWWLPVVAMYFFPLLLTVVWPWFPESPYWLIRHGRPDDAKKSLRRIYGFKEAEYYDIEVTRIQEEIRLTSQLHGYDDSKAPRRFLGVRVEEELQCFDKMNRKRTFTAIFCASAQQMIGATFVIGYATYFLQLIGIGNYFAASSALYAVMLLSSIAAFPLTEMYGRRFLIVRPQFVLCFMLLIIGILGCVPNKAKASWGIVAILYVWAIIYQLSIGATGFVLASEVATMRLRAATQGLVTITNSIWGLISKFLSPKTRAIGEKLIPLTLNDLVQFTVPYMINTDAGNLGGKVGFIFLGLGLMAAVGGYYLFPETKGLSFEQIDELYAMKVHPKHFKKVAEEAAGRHIIPEFNMPSVPADKEGVQVETV